MSTDTHTRAEPGGFGPPPPDGPASGASDPDLGLDVHLAIPAQRTGGYQSPLMARLATTERLTLDLLREQVPPFQAGRAAEERLKEPDVPATERAVLLRQRMAGQVAKERLLLAAVPLIKHLAQKEHARRQAWQSKVSMDDLVQEGTIGLMLGLAKYNPHGTHGSATNYLGQWVLTTMRRNVEVIDNDFGVAFDAVERFRRIRALRSRLCGELNREPTDEEMIAAWDDPRFTGGRKLGRVVKAPPKAPSKGLTLAHLAEERRMRNQVGAVTPMRSGSEDEGLPDVDNRARPLGEGVRAEGAAEDVVEDGVREGLARLLKDTLDAMGLPPVQRDVVARRWGLPPHEEEQSVRDIARALALHRERVGKVVEAFGAEMSRPGGAFHRVCSSVDPEDLADLRLGWVPARLGAYEQVPADQRGQQPPTVLVEALAPRGPAVPPPPPTQPAPGRSTHVRGQFVCEYHASDFVGVYLRRADVPAARACPRCGRPSRLVRVLAQ